MQSDGTDRIHDVGTNSTKPNRPVRVVRKRRDNPERHYARLAPPRPPTTALLPLAAALHPAQSSSDVLKVTTLLFAVAFVLAARAGVLTGAFFAVDGAALREVLHNNIRVSTYSG